MAEGSTNDAVLDSHYENMEKMYSLKSKLKRYKTNTSKLQQHELQLFELKEVEKESNK